MPTKSIFESLYYELGNRLVGIKRFEQEFLRAEDSLEYDTVAKLLELLGDKTLYQDNKRLPWYHYFQARESLLWGHIEKAKQALDQIDEEAFKVLPELALRVDLMQEHLLVIRQDFVKAIDDLIPTIRALKKHDVTLVSAEAQELLARAFVGRALISGGWSKTPQRGVTEWLAGISRISLVPFLVPIWIWVWVRTGIPLIIQSLWKHSTSTSDWPIFAFYVRALVAVHRARNLLANFQQADPEAQEFRDFSLALLEADLYRFLHIPRKALEGYKALVNGYSSNTYYLALAKHGLGYAYFDQGSLEQAKDALKEAETAYNSARVSPIELARLSLIRGEVEFRSGNGAAALELWRDSLHTFKAEEDKTGLAQILALPQRVLDKPANTPAEITESLSALVDEVSPKIFTVRLPTRSFMFLQRMGWLAPVLALFVFFYVMGRSIGVGTYEDLNRLAANAPATGSSAVVFSLLVLGAVNGALGFLWVFFSRWTEVTSLDYFTTDKEGITHFNSRSEMLWKLDWTEITAHVQVERAIWNTPIDLLSFDIIRSQKGEPVIIPCVTNALSTLRGEIERQSNHTSQRLVSRLYYGVWFLVTSLAFWLGFKLSEAVLYKQQVSILIHAILASGVTLVTFIALFIFLSKEYVLHLTNTWHLCSRRWVLRGASIAGITFIAVAVPGYRWGKIVLFEPIIACIGVALLVGTLRYPPANLSRAQKRIVTIGRSALWGAGILVVIWLTTLYVVRVFGYTMVRAVRMEPGWSISEHERQTSFSHLDQAGKVLQVIDPMSPFASLYRGLVAYARGDYDKSITFFSEGVDKTNGDPDFVFCLAMVCQEVEHVRCKDIPVSFKQDQSKDFTFICYRVFPEESRTLLSDLPRQFSSKQGVLP